MQLQVRRVIKVASDAQLLNPHYRRRLWIALRNEGISRRTWPDVLAATIYDFDGEILNPNGTPWDVPYIDDVMGDPRWISALLEECNGEPCRDTRMIERLRLLDLYFRIKRPHIQRHFGR
ncbi:MAG: hypothetical protein KDF59_06160 [Nitrosomonas sp.]|nr:hypothetical protein [Nitrosomonas sp.]